MLSIYHKIAKKSIRLHYEKTSVESVLQRSKALALVLLSELNLKELRRLNAFRLSLPAQDSEKASSAEVSRVSRKCSYASLSTTQRQEIVALYKQGVMVQQIANQYGIHRTTIIRVVRQAGGEPRSAALSDEEVRRIVELYVRDRLAIGAIARLTRHSKATIHAVLKREGVAMRSPGRRQFPLSIGA